MTDSFLCISAPCGGLYKEKGSKFIAFAFPVADEQEIKRILAKVKKEHFGARHWCYAWRLGPAGKAYRASDDGEPSGTAGRPILNQLVAAGLSNTLVIVVRYFGGTLLGTSGLLNAYRSATADALAKAQVVTRYITGIYSIDFHTAQTNEVMRALKIVEANILSHQFEDHNEVTFSLRLSKTAALKEYITKNHIACQLRKM